MKKMLGLLLSLLLAYLIIQFLFNYFGSGHDISYSIDATDGKIDVREVLNINSKEKNNYYLEISYNDKIIPFKIYNTYWRQDKIIKSVGIFETDDYTCALIILDNDEKPSDIKCNHDDTIYYYHSIIGQDEALDNLIKETDYNIKKYTSNLTNEDTIGRITYYPNNLVDGSYVLINDYKGVNILSNKYASDLTFVDLFSTDIYESKIKIGYDDKYIIADYNKNREFDIFYVIDLKKAKKVALKSDYDISFNSIIQGEVDGKIYLLDLDNSKQYVIDLKHKKVSLQNDGIAFINNDWTNMNISEMVDKKLTFGYNSSEVLYGMKYSKIILRGTQEDGTYYVFEMNNGKYDVYAIYPNKLRNYLFSTTDIDRIYISEKNIYYLDGADLMAFGPDYGTKKIATNTEFNFNKYLEFYVY